MSDFEQIDLDGNAKKLKFYTIEKKLEVVAYAKKAKSINSASKRYNVDRKCVRKWMEQEEQLSKFNKMSKLLIEGVVVGGPNGLLLARLLQPNSAAAVTVYERSTSKESSY
uniref:Brinker DNA-binding domain-containing protein n=1 Tax=Ditylenchus dipsaci TaxID=166011 RepID=A0A915DDF4_9BILA